jgi:NAD(P)-dependent dehydrogenase (short-subunit alcohol dehydrogenase family)
VKARRVFITGAASGLGRALAERYARAGARVCLADIDDARGAKALAQLQAGGATAHFLHCDVTSEADFEAAAEWLCANWGGVDIVVNNAGVAQIGAIDATPLADWRWIVDINLLGVVRGCRVFAPLLRAQGGGTIVNIASMAGLVHLPNAAAYNATKAAVIALSETLQLELERDIKVSVVCPAFFRTDLAKTMRASNADSERIARRLVERARFGADEIAKAVVEGVKRGDTHILTHPEGRAAWKLKRFLPYGLYLRLLRKQLDRFEARMARSPNSTQQDSHDRQ